jgi:hypothetical protein
MFPRSSDMSIVEHTISSGSARMRFQPRLLCPVLLFSLLSLRANGAERCGCNPDPKFGTRGTFSARIFRYLIIPGKVTVEYCSARQDFSDSVIYSLKTSESLAVRWPDAEIIQWRTPLSSLGVIQKRAGLYVSYHTSSMIWTGIFGWPQPVKAFVPDQPYKVELTQCDSSGGIEHRSAISSEGANRTSQFRIAAKSMLILSDRARSALIAEDQTKREPIRTVRIGVNKLVKYEPKKVFISSAAGGLAGVLASSVIERSARGSWYGLIAGAGIGAGVELLRSWIRAYQKRQMLSEWVGTQSEYLAIENRGDQSETFNLGSPRDFVDGAVPVMELDIRTKDLTGFKVSVSRGR